MSDYVTHSELDAAMAEVRDDIRKTETRLRAEWTDAVRYEVGKIDEHLVQQDGRLNWTLGLVVTLLLSLMSGLVYTVLHFA